MSEVPLFAGLQTAEEQELFNQLVKQREQLDYHCFLFLQSLKPLLEALSELTEKRRVTEEDIRPILEQVCEEEMLETVQDLLDNRSIVNDRLIGLVSGKAVR